MLTRRLRMAISRHSSMECANMGSSCGEAPSWPHALPPPNELSRTEVTARQGSRREHVL
jgi:hypothetical protein